MRKTLIAAVILTVGCGQQPSMAASDFLTAEAIAGEEEERVDGGFAEMGGDRGAQPMFRLCDPAGGFEKLFEQADANADGRLGHEEGDQVRGRHPRGEPPMWRLLMDVYDTDFSGELDEAEREVLFGDFEVRCELLHERLIEEFDVDGDGELSQEEAQVAQAEHGPPPGAGGAPPRPAPGELPGPLAEFDLDESGELDEAEWVAFREATRERIRSGEPPPGLDAPS